MLRVGHRRHLGSDALELCGSFRITLHTSSWLYDFWENTLNCGHGALCSFDIR